MFGVEERNPFEDVRNAYPGVAEKRSIVLGREIVLIPVGPAGECDRLGYASESSEAGSKARIEHQSCWRHGKKEEEDVGVKNC